MAVAVPVIAGLAAGIACLLILSVLGTGSIVSLEAFAQDQQEDLQILQAIPMHVANHTYFLYYQMSNGGSIDSISTDTYLTMKMNVTSPSNGTLQLNFPRELYDALTFTEHDEPILFENKVSTGDFIQTNRSCEAISIVIAVQAGTRELEIAYADILMEHTHSYPEHIQLVKEIEKGNHIFTVVLTTDAKKCDVTFSEEELKMQIDIQGRNEVTTTDQGYFAITIPHELIGGSYTVLVDGDEVNYVQEPYGNAAFYSGDSPVSVLAFNYTKEASRIKILGTKVAFDYLSYPALSNMVGDIIYDIDIGSQSIISLSVKNNNPTEEPYVILVEIRDGNDVTRDLFWQSGIIGANDKYTMETSWTPKAVGNNYQIRSFIIQDINSTVPSSGVFTLKGISVVESPLYQFCCSYPPDLSSTATIMNTSYSFEYSLDSGYIAETRADFDALSMLMTFEGIRKDSYLTLQLSAPLLHIFFPDEQIVDLEHLEGRLLLFLDELEPPEYEIVGDNQNHIVTIGLAIPAESQGLEVVVDKLI